MIKWICKCLAYTYIVPVVHRVLIIYFILGRVLFKRVCLLSMLPCILVMYPFITLV